MHPSGETAIHRDNNVSIDFDGPTHVFGHVLPKLFQPASWRRGRDIHHSTMQNEMTLEELKALWTLIEHDRELIAGSPPVLPLSCFSSSENHTVAFNITKPL